MLINLRSDLAVGGLIADAVQNKKSKTEISAFKVFTVCVVGGGRGVGRRECLIKAGTSLSGTQDRCPPVPW